jgi:hypothetical protein
VQTLILKRQIEIHKEEKNIRLGELVIIKSDSDIKIKDNNDLGWSGAVVVGEMRKNIW